MAASTNESRGRTATTGGIDDRKGEEVEAIRGTTFKSTTVGNPGS